MSTQVGGLSNHFYGVTSNDERWTVLDCDWTLWLLQETLETATSTQDNLDQRKILES